MRSVRRGAGILFLGVVLGAPGARAATLLAPVGESRHFLPWDAAGSVRLPLALAIASDLSSLTVSSLAVRGPDDEPLADAVQSELGGSPPFSAGSLLDLGLTARADAFRFAGEYHIEVELRAVAVAEVRFGPPPEERQLVRLSVVRRATALAVRAPEQAVARIRPWDTATVARATLVVASPGGANAPRAVAAALRGSALALDRGLQPVAVAVRTIRVDESPGGESRIELEIAGALAAGRYRVPLEVRSPSSPQAVAVDLDLWLRHGPEWLVLALAGGALVGLLLGAVTSRRRAREASAATAGTEREGVAALMRGLEDGVAIERLGAVLRALESAESRGRSVEVGRAVDAARHEVAWTLLDLEDRRIRVERALLELETILLPSASDPGEVEEVLRGLVREVDDLHVRVARGDIEGASRVAAELGKVAEERIAEAGRAWLGAAHETLQGLRSLIPTASAHQLGESVRYSLETYARRVGTHERTELRELVQAGRAAATTLVEQSFALAFRPGFRSLTEAFAIVTEFVAEESLAAADAARKEVQAALERGDLRTPGRLLDGLAHTTGRIETLLLDAAAGAGENAIAGVRTALAERDPERAAHLLERALRPGPRAQEATRPRTRIVEIVRLHVKPPLPRLRITWDAPARAGFPLHARIAWVGPEPREGRVRWLVDGVGAGAQALVGEAVVVVPEKAGWVSLHAFADTESAPIPLAAHTRLRVLDVGTPGSFASRLRRGWVGSALAGIGVLTLAVALGLVVLLDGFSGTPRDYALAGGFGLAVDLVVERLRQTFRSGRTDVVRRVS